MSLRSPSWILAAVTLCASSARAQEGAMSAYHRALAQRRAGISVNAVPLARSLPLLEAKLRAGRRDEAIAELRALVEAPGFGAISGSQDGRYAIFLLGDALGQSGA